MESSRKSPASLKGGVQSRFLRNQIMNRGSLKKIINEPPLVAAFSSIDARAFHLDEESPAYLYRI